jgi:hypothetical protein
LHARYRRVGVGSGELELDVPVEFLEALLAEAGDVRRALAAGAAAAVAGTRFLLTAPLAAARVVWPSAHGPPERCTPVITQLTPLGALLRSRSAPLQVRDAPSKRGVSFNGLEPRFPWK